MIPNELTDYPQWVNWQLQNDASGKPTKIPFNPISGKLASVTDPHTWNSYATVCAAMSTGYYSGIGFVLTEADPYTFIDLDDPQGDPEIQLRHNKVLAMMDSYAEWSPSGRGMHIIVKGSVPDGRRRAKMEVYSTLRYMTVTGNTYHDAPIADRHDLLQPFWADLGGTNKGMLAVREEVADKSDLEIYNIAVNAANGEKFYLLWQGRFQDAGYPSQSEADYALVNMLGFYSRNVQQIERMFLSSGLGYRIASGAKKKAKNYITAMALKSFDNQEPDIDISELLSKAEIHQKKPKRVELPNNVPALEWEMPPGLLGEITQFIYAAAPLQVKEVALAGALGMLAGIVGRYYNVENQGLNLYVLVLAETGNGKEAAASGIGKLMDAVSKLVPAANDFRGPSEIASGPALTKFLGDKSPCCFSILGEFGLRLHQMANDLAPAHMVGIKRLLLDLYHKSSKGSTLQPHIYSDKAKNTDVVHSPAFTILGESTPSTFFRNIDESMIADGLLPRFICIEYTGDRKELNRSHASVAPSESLINGLATLVTTCLGMGANKRVLDVMFTPAAKDMYWALASEYTSTINANRDNGVLRELYNRAHAKVMRVAGLIAVGVNPMYPVIEVDYIEWSRRLVERDILNILDKFQSGRIGREASEINQASEIAKVISEYIHRPYGPTLAKALVPENMHKARIVPYSYILRCCAARASFRTDRIGSTFALKRALESLMSEGLIREVKPHVLQEHFGKSMKAYAVVEPEAFVSK